jgi:hypothetical protein
LISGSRAHIFEVVFEVEEIVEIEFETVEDNMEEGRWTGTGVTGLRVGFGSFSSLISSERVTLVIIM